MNCYAFGDTFMIDKNDLIEWSKCASEKEIEGFVKLPVFETEEEGLLYLIINLMPSFNAQELMDNWGVGKEMAYFLVMRTAAAMVYLGADIDDA
jgi:hypothetical protein